MTICGTGIAPFRFTPPLGRMSLSFQIACQPRKIDAFSESMPIGIDGERFEAADQMVIHVPVRASQPEFRDSAVFFSEA